MNCECGLELFDGKCVLCGHEQQPPIIVSRMCSTCRCEAELIDNDYVCPRCGLLMDTRDDDVLNIGEMRGYSGGETKIMTGYFTLSRSYKKDYSLCTSEYITQLLFETQMELPKNVQETAIEYFLKLIENTLKRSEPRLAITVVCLYYACQKHHIPYSLYELTRRLGTNNNHVTKAEHEFRKMFKISSNTVNEQITLLANQFGLQEFIPFIKGLYMLSTPRNIRKSYRPPTRIKASVMIAGLCSGKLDKTALDSSSTRFIKQFVSVDDTPFRALFTRYSFHYHLLR